MLWAVLAKKEDYCPVCSYPPKAGEPSYCSGAVSAATPANCPMRQVSNQGTDYRLKKHIWTNYLGVQPNANIPIAKLASPVQYVINASKPLAPTLIVHAVNDPQVPIERFRLKAGVDNLVKHLEDINSPYQVVELNDSRIASHEAHGFDPFSEEAKFEPSFCSIFNFLDNTLKK
jgi:hypothetical protein